MENRRVIILGAGLAGLSAAWVLRKNGVEVHLIDKAPTNGGLAVTKTHGKYLYDLGPHNIHTVHNHIVTFLKRNFSDELFEHNPTSKILKNGSMIDYPLKGVKVIFSLPKWKIPFAVNSFFWARVMMFLRNPQRDSSFQDWIKNRFGALLYNEYFGNYAGKVWGIHPSKIDKYVAEKRIPTIGLFDLLRAALMGQPTRIDHPEFLDKNYYLRKGIGRTVDFFETELKRLGANFYNDAKLESVHREGGRFSSVSFTNKQGEKKTLSCDFLLTTIPVPEFISLIDAVPEPVQRAAKELDYCATVLVFVKTRSLKPFPSTMLYFSDPRVQISRVYDVGAYSQAMVPDGKALFCAELPCSAGDATWSRSDAELGKIVTEVFVSHGLFQEGDVDGTFIERISHSYPRFRLGFQARLKECFKFLDGISNTISYGRQGAFAYLNTDGVMNQGMAAAGAILLAESTGYTCPEWFLAKTRVRPGAD